MNVSEFRAIALSFPDAEEGAHMGHPDFRIHGRIFATLSPDLSSGMAKLTPEQQADLISISPASFAPAAGAWGTGGATMISLQSADASLVHDALSAAYQNVGRKYQKR